MILYSRFGNLSFRLFRGDILRLDLAAAAACALTLPRFADRRFFGHDPFAPVMTGSLSSLLSNKYLSADRTVLALCLAGLCAGGYGGVDRDCVRFYFIDRRVHGVACDDFNRWCPSGKCIVIIRIGFLDRISFAVGRSRSVSPFAALKLGRVIVQEPDGVFVRFYGERVSANSLG